MILRKINKVTIDYMRNKIPVTKNKIQKKKLEKFRQKREQNGNKTVTVPTNTIADFPEIHMMIAKKTKDCVALNFRCIKKKIIELNTIIFTSRDYLATTTESGLFGFNVHRLEYIIR